MSVAKPTQNELPSLPALWLSLAAVLLVGSVLAVTVVLPAERGIDITGVGERLRLTRMGQLKVALSEPDAPAENRPKKSDTVSLILQPGQGHEVKMEMTKDFTASYRWSSTGGPVEHDTHGDPYGNSDIYVSYSLADSVDQDDGVIKALYGGFHGWYWKNNGSEPVTIDLSIDGEYLQLTGHD